MNKIKEVKDTIQREVLAALSRAVEDGRLPDGSPPVFAVEAPRDKNHGDFAVNVAMLMSKSAGMQPRAIAQAIADHISPDTDWLEKVEIAGPGFLNFHLVFDYFHPVLDAVLEEDRIYGSGDSGRGRKVQIEFVSANPTGLLHMGNARGAALGDSLANAMAAAGFDVSREYYINDAGNQIENFGKSLEARYLGLLGEQTEFPEDGYQGEDITDTARRILEQVGDSLLHEDRDLRRAFLVKEGLREKLGAIRQSLEAFGVRFDVWFSEQSLHENGRIKETVSRMREKGLIYEKDGAVWLKATAFGDEKDEVMVRASGFPTYYAGDVAYHRDKFERGFETVINIWGADHHGHVARMKSAVGALGYDPDRLEVILMQLVRLMRGQEIVRMSKRSGMYVTLDELVEEVGKDAARFFFVMRAAESQMDFDIELAKSQNNENPVYYVQYAHARICSLLKMAKMAGGASLRGSDGNVPDESAYVADVADAACSGAAAAVAAYPDISDTAACPDIVHTDADDSSTDWLGADLTRLVQPAERELIRKLAELPEEIIRAATDREPHHLPRYAMELAALYHSFYDKCKCLVDDIPLRKARLQLSDATRIALRNVLAIIGVSAPDRM